MPAKLSYDAAENIVFMSFPEREELKTKGEIAAHFDHVIAFWKMATGGRKAYFLVDFENVSIDASELDFYASQSKRAQDLSTLMSVRYGGDPLQRTVTRLAGLKIHRPSHIYETREEALAVVRKLKAGELKARSDRQ